MPPSRRTVLFLIGSDRDDAGSRPAGDAWSRVAGEVEVVGVDRDADWWASTPASELDAGDVVVLADADWLPGPEVLERLAAAAGADGLVDARVLPVETTRVVDPREDGDEPEPLTTPPELRISAACCLAPSSRLADVAPLWRIPLADGRGQRLAEWADAAGVTARVEPAATVFLPLRVDDRGVPLAPVDPAATDPFEPPADLHPAALPATSLASLLDGLGLRLDGLVADPSADRPFLTIVTRTQGTRAQCLEETLTCLAAQTNRDFELLVVRHRATPDGRAAVEGALDLQPAWLRGRTRLVDVERPGRSAPLNDGFEAARGRYVAVLDDDDTVLAHWVEVFASLERQAPGRVLRAVALRQDVAPLPDRDSLYPVAVGNPFSAWSAAFELVDHLRVNHSPCMSVAFPRGVFHDLGLRFDESLPANEDWDFVLRAAGLVGAQYSTEVTSVYRWWLEQASSRELHTAEEWDDARDRVLAKADASVMLLPPGASTRFREVTDEGWQQAAAQREEALSLATTLNDVIAQLDASGSGHERTMQDLVQARERLATAVREAKQARRQLRQRTRRFRRRAELMGYADDLLQLTGTRGEHPSVFELDSRQLRALITELEGQLATRTARGRRSRR